MASRPARIKHPRIDVAYHTSAKFCHKVRKTCLRRLYPLTKLLSCRRLIFKGDSCVRHIRSIDLRQCSRIIKGAVANNQFFCVHAIYF